MTAVIWSDPLLVMTIGVVAGTLTTGCLIPQAIRTHRTRSAGDLSLVYLAAMDGGVALWIVYGLCVASIPIVVANSISAVLVTYLVLFKVRQTGSAPSERALRPRRRGAATPDPAAPSSEQDAA